MDNDTFLIGAVLAAVFVICALWHIRENTKLEHQLQKKMDAQTAQWLVRFAWSRTFQLLAALICAIVIFINYDRQLSESRNSLDSLTAAVEKKDKLEQAQLAEQKRLKIQEEQDRKKLAAAAVASIPVAPVTPPAAIQPPQSDYSAEEAGAKTPGNRNNETIEALYNPERNQTDRQSSMDDIKKRYEDIIVIYLFLKKCNKIAPDDFDIINYALSQEMASVKAPEKLHDDIMNAAQGSYNEIYAKSACDGKGIGDLSVQYTNYIKVLAANFPKS